MITLNVLYTAKPGMREEFIRQAESKGILAKIRGEEGNICYDYFLSRDNGDQILLLERWENQEVLSRHLAAPHMAELAAVKDQCVADTRIEKFEK